MIGNFFERVSLPFGLSWFPSKDEKKYIVIRVADPRCSTKPITKYYKLAEINSEMEALALIEKLISIRDDIGSRLWDDWPDVARERKSGFISDIPKGVSCIICNNENSSKIRVTCYWQDYNRPKNRNGQYPQSKKTYILPIESSERKIRKVISKAKEYREWQLKLHPKPPRR